MVALFFNWLGGWTIVSRNIIKETSQPVEGYNKREITGSFDKNEFTLIHGHAMTELYDKMGFDQIHFYCRKKSVGRVISLVTKNDTAGHEVVRFFTDKKFAKTTFPGACGSYEVLPEDTSILSQNCTEWGDNGDQWAAETSKGQYRLCKSPISARSGKHVFGFYTNDFDDLKNGNISYISCDDAMFSPSTPGDVIQISVR